MAVKKTGAAAKTVARTAVAPKDTEKTAEAANIAPATGFGPSGAPQQDSGNIDPGHIAVDNDPRAGTSKTQNQIDFNDPRPDKGPEAVAQALNVQGLPTKTASDADKE
jgi:hypothetical protein